MNSQLVKENSPVAQKYNNKSVSEQNSVDLAWDLMMRPEYEQLRNCMCYNEDEFVRFRQVRPFNTLVTASIFL